MNNDKTEIFVLSERDQIAVESLYHDIQMFFFESAIREVALRSAPVNGPYSASAHVYKVEAVLQLVDLLDVTLVHPNRIVGWEKRENPALPVPKGGFSSSESKALAAAMSTAAFIESAGGNASSARFLADLLGG